MWKKRREQRIRTQVLEDSREVLVPIWYRRKTSNPTSPRTRTNLKAKASLMARTRPHTQPTSRRSLIRRKELATFVVILTIGLLAALIALTNVGTAARRLVRYFSYCPFSM